MLADLSRRQILVGSAALWAWLIEPEPLRYYSIPQTVRPGGRHGVLYQVSGMGPVDLWAEPNVRLVLTRYHGPLGLHTIQRCRVDPSSGIFHAIAQQTSWREGQYEYTIPGLLQVDAPLPGDPEP